MRTIDTLENYIRKEISVKKHLTPIAPDQSLLETGILDSMGILKLVAFIEKRFKVKFDDTDLLPQNFETIRSLEQLVTSKNKSI
jgi:acyl carrier protein